MGYSLMAICVLVALVLARFIHGRPTVDENGLNLSMSESRASKLEDFSIHEPKAISLSILHGSSSFPAKPRQKRLSDQRRAELETMLGLTKITGKRSLNATQGNWQNRSLDPEKIGRRKRFAVRGISAESISIIRLVEKPKREGDPTYPLVSWVNTALMAKKVCILSQGMSLAYIRRTKSLNIAYRFDTA